MSDIRRRVPMRFTRPGWRCSRTISILSLYATLVVLNPPVASCEEVRIERDVGYLGADRIEKLDLYFLASMRATVPVRQSELLHAALQKVGVSSQLVVIEGATHSFHLQPKQRDLRSLVVDFFDRHLKRSDASR